jgi:hypothetical protein
VRDELLEKARKKAEKAEPSVRAAALLRIARAESGIDSSRARETLLEALNVVRELPGGARENLLDEARRVAAAVSPELLASVPVGERRGSDRFESMNIVSTMLTHGHVDAAYDYVLQYDDPGSFPFLSVGGVLHRTDHGNPEFTDRRLKLLRRAVEMWRQAPSGLRFHERGSFVGLFGRFWKEFAPEEAVAVAQSIVARAAEEPESGGHFGYSKEVQFTSPRQNTLFQILHVLRDLDPALAESLINSNDQLAAAARRYPNGTETMREEAEAEMQRRKLDGKACGGGYILGGSPEDIERQRRLIDATQSGDFEPCIQDAMEKYEEDTAPDTRNYAPKEYWPSTGAFRSLFYQAGKRLGPEAVKMLERVPDDDLRLFAMIELAAALGGAPGASITRMKRPRPNAHGFKRERIIDARSMRLPSEGSGESTMRSPDGCLIRCPKCQFQPAEGLRWTCKCGHVWNTFWTSGNCPACHFQWEETQCPRCHEMSEHRAWYISEA